MADTKSKAQPPEGAGGYRDASTAQGGSSVLPAWVSMTMWRDCVWEVRPDEPGPHGRTKASVPTWVAPARSQGKFNINSNFKGNGQECPFHTFHLRLQEPGSSSVV